MACLKDDVEAALLHGRARDVVAVPQNLAVRGVRDAEQDVEQRVLAASGWSQHRDDLSVLDGEVDVVQNAVVRIRLADMLPPWSIGLLANARRGYAHTRVRCACAGRAGECE
mgnify:CR=1 FL=1